jgi:hypothetical protein
LKLVSQPPLQLLLAFSSLASFPSIESGAADGVRAVDDGVRAADDFRRDATVFATCFGICGLATCFGASTVMVGSGPAEPVAVCDDAGPHSKTVDKTATAEGATKLDDNPMTMSSRGRTCRPNAYTSTSRNFRTWPLRVERISADDRLSATSCCSHHRLGSAAQE